MSLSSVISKVENRCMVCSRYETRQYSELLQGALFCMDDSVHRVHKLTLLSPDLTGVLIEIQQTHSPHRRSAAVGVLVDV